MALVVKDRVKETTTTTGTGTVTLGGAASGFQSFSVIGNGNTTYYTITDSAAGTWEVGIGTYTSAGTTLSRDTVLESSNAGSLVNFAAGTKDVFCTYPAERAVFTDIAQTLTSKRVSPRVNNNGATTSGNITPTGDDSDQYEILGLTGAITLLAPSGTPTAGQKLILRFKDNGTARGITWTTTSGGYRAVNVSLPTTTVISKVLYVGCIYNATDVFWDVVSVAQQA